MSTIPKEASGTPLSSEQLQYLDGFFAGIRNRGLSFADAAPGAGPPSQPPQPQPGKLTQEERIKREKPPLDAIGDLRAKARADAPPEKDDIFRFKWNGLFWLAPVHEGYMCRLRIPGGIVTAAQFRELADISEELASGYLQLTTRNNVQIRVIQPRDTLELIRRVEECGLKTRGSGADNLRNFTMTPTSGLDPHELVDVRPYVRELAHLVQNSQEFYDLPRKFNISFDSGGAVPVAEDTNDIGLRAVRKGGETFFQILLGGVTGHQAFAEDSGYLCRPEQAVDVCLALVRVWIRHGRRDQRGKARLLYLVKEWGAERTLAEARKLLDFDLTPCHAAELDPVARPDFPHPQIGTYPQKEAGLSYLGVSVPVGLLDAEQARAVARVAETFGTGELRLTIFQNLILTNIPNEHLGAAKAALREAGLATEASLVRGGAAACTGNRHCKYAGADTKGDTLALIEHLESRLVLDRPINIHTTGCPHSCAQHYIGDIGLLACKVKVEGREEPVEGYHVFVGGGFGPERQRIGRQLLKSVPAGPELHGRIETLLKGYLARREPGESFLDFTARHSLEDLAALVA